MTENPIRRGLEQDAQIISERKPEPMSQTTKQNIMMEYAERLKAFMADNDISQKQMAKLIGQSATTVNQLLKANYKGDVEKMISKVVEVINSYDSRSRHKGSGYVETTIAMAIGGLIKNVDGYSGDNEGCIGVVIGDSGHGKSECLRQYAKVNQHGYYIQLDDSMGTRDIFAAIGRAVGTTESGLKSVIARRIIDKLCDRHAILFIDEASSLNVSVLNQLRQVIVDQSACPMILSGNADLLKTIESGRSRKGYESLDQFQSRMLRVLNLDEIASNGDGGLYSPKDMQKLYQYGGIKLAKSAIKTLRKICCVPQTGRLRTCNKIIAALHTSSIVKKEGSIDGELIIAAISELRLPVERKLPLIRNKEISEPSQQQLAQAV